MVDGLFLMVTLKPRGPLVVPWELHLGLMTASCVFDHSLVCCCAEHPCLPSREHTLDTPACQSASLCLHFAPFQAVVCLLILSLNQLLMPGVRQT